MAKIKAEIPELYILGNPPASVVAFASKHPKVNALEVGDIMAKRGWHLNALADPPAVHIAVTVGDLVPHSTVLSDMAASVWLCQMSTLSSQISRILYGKLSRTRPARAPWLHCMVCDPTLCVL